MMEGMMKRNEIIITYQTGDRERSKMDMNKVVMNKVDMINKME